MIPAMLFGMLIYNLKIKIIKLICCLLPLQHKVGIKSHMG